MPAKKERKFVIKVKRLDFWWCGEEGNLVNDISKATRYDVLPGAQQCSRLNGGDHGVTYFLAIAPEDRRKNDKNGYTFCYRGRFKILSEKVQNSSK